MNVNDIITLTTPEQDSRIGKQAIAPDGCTGVIDSITTHADGWECIHIINHQTGLGHGGILPSEITILE